MILDFLILPEEKEEDLSSMEKWMRKGFDRSYRFILGSFLSYHVFDFLFSPIWMHGYVWSLNLPIELDMADKSAGLIVDHQLKQVGYTERMIYSVIVTFTFLLLLSRCGFTYRSQRMSSLLSLATVLSLIVIFVKTTQMKHRLFPSLHESCYAFVYVFVIGLALTIRTKSDRDYRFPVDEKTTVEDKSTVEDVPETKKNLSEVSNETKKNM